MESPNGTRLIISIDIGTSTSAVVVFCQMPGIATETIVNHVDRWPGQENKIWEQKVPSVMLYSGQGELRSCGAEALAQERSADGINLYLVKHFKMLMHPTEIVQDNKLPVPALPFGITLQTVYSDYMAYLVDHTKVYLIDLNPTVDWLQLVERAEVILAHPNRWGREQQRTLERAAVAAGLVTNDHIGRNLSFVEESETSASFCLTTNPKVATRIKVGSKIVVCDVGGSTCDITPYQVTRTGRGKETRVAELALPSCIYAGGVRVDEEFKIFLRRTLTQIKWDSGEDDLEDMIADGFQSFLDTIKCTYVSSRGVYQLKVGGRRLNVHDGSVTIKRGELAIEGQDIEGCFSPSVGDIIGELHRVIDVLGDLPLILFTGGFCDSPYLKFKIKEAFIDHNRVIFANPTNSKAVAIGGLKLQLGGAGAVTVLRVQRPWLSLLADFARKLGIFGRR